MQPTPAMLEERNRVRVALELKAAEIEKNALERIALASFWVGDAAKINKARADVINATERWLDALHDASNLGIAPTA